MMKRARWGVSTPRGSDSEAGNVGSNVPTGYVSDEPRQVSMREKWLDEMPERLVRTALSEVNANAEGDSEEVRDRFHRYHLRECGILGVPWTSNDMIPMIDDAVEFGAAEIEQLSDSQARLLLHLLVLELPEVPTVEDNQVWPGRNGAQPEPSSTRASRSASPADTLGGTKPQHRAETEESARREIGTSSSHQRRVITAEWDGKIDLECESLQSSSSHVALRQREAPRKVPRDVPGGTQDDAAEQCNCHWPNKAKAEPNRKDAETQTDCDERRDRRRRRRHQTPREEKNPRREAKAREEDSPLEEETKVMNRRRMKRKRKSRKEKKTTKRKNARRRRKTKEMSDQHKISRKVKNRRRTKKLRNRKSVSAREKIAGNRRGERVHESRGATVTSESDTEKNASLSDGADESEDSARRPGVERRHVRRRKERDKCEPPRPQLRVRRSSTVPQQRSQRDTRDNARECRLEFSGEDSVGCEDFIGQSHGKLVASNTSESSDVQTCAFLAERTVRIVASLQRCGESRFVRETEGACAGTSATAEDRDDGRERDRDRYHDASIRVNRREPPSCDR